MNDVVVATSNPGKLVEIGEILGEGDFHLCGLADFPGLRFPDEGDDYLENAATKARVAADFARCLALADDSGLEVAGLGGAPGPRSARFGGPGLDDRGRVAHLLEALRGSRGAERDARFVCVAALANARGDVVTAWGECAGRILAAPRGEGGFGYDPIFEPRGRGLTMAELSAEEKNRISHRARAFLDLRPALVEWLDRGP